MMMTMIRSHGVCCSAVDLDLAPFLSFGRQALRFDVYIFSDVLHSLESTTAFHDVGCT